MNRHAFKPFLSTRFCDVSGCGELENHPLHLSDDVEGDRFVPMQPTTPVASVEGVLATEADGAGDLDSPKPKAPCFSQTAIPKDIQLDADQWQPIESGLPEAGIHVLAFFRYFSTGKGRTVRAMYVPHLTLSEDDWGDFQGDTDYNDATDQTYWPEGWYETNECEETHWKLTEEVTHWMPLPAPPITQDGASPKERNSTTVTDKGSVQHETETVMVWSKDADGYPILSIFI